MISSGGGIGWNDIFCLHLGTDIGSISEDLQYISHQMSEFSQSFEPSIRHFSSFYFIPSSYLRTRRHFEGAGTRVPRDDPRAAQQPRLAVRAAKPAVGAGGGGAPGPGRRSGNGSSTCRPARGYKLPCLLTLLGFWPKLLSWRWLGEKSGVAVGQGLCGCCWVCAGVGFCSGDGLVMDRNLRSGFVWMLLALVLAEGSVLG